jgi:uncharacterized protein (DUF169 family)
MNTTVQTLLRLEHPPIGIGFFDSAPADVPFYEEGPQPAGCAFWKLAWNGRSFVTRPEDHFGCAVGAHTHHLPLPKEREGELMDTVGFMVESGYVKAEEVPFIPTLQVSPKFVAYGPADDGHFTPDVVIVCAKPAQAMLLYEGALHAGAGGMVSQALGRPGCAVLPLTVNSKQAAFSFGCKGNRTFTGLPDEEMYLSVPGQSWPKVRDALVDILRADRTMGEHYTGKLDAATRQLS